VNLAASLLDAHLEAGLGDRSAIRYRGATLSYADAAQQTGRVANGLRALGIDIEQRVAIVLPDSPEFVATFLGAMRIGAVPVTLSTQLPSEDYAYLLRDSRARAVVTTAALWPKLEPVRAGLRSLRHVIVAEGDAPGATSYEALVAAQATEVDPADTTDDDMAFWQYSSGTTGLPKAVVHLHGNAIWPADLHGKHVVGMTADDRVYSVARLFFSYGLNNSLVIPFRHGATTILVAERPDPKIVFETITAERPTVFYSVPTSYSALVAYPEEGFTHDLSSIRLCVSAGEALPAPIFRRWMARFGHQILDGIGSTEIGYICISNFPGRARQGTSGEVIPGYEAVVHGPDGQPVPAGEVGDLLVRGPSTAAFYWGKRERTKQTFRGEWVFTGDRYSVDGDGFYTYQGRSDDLLRVSGMWVSPLEVESALLSHPGVREVAVVGHADGDGLEKPYAFVVPKDGQDDDAFAMSLHQLARDKLAPFKRPRWIEFIEDLPKTSTGKIQRYKLRQR
jgi:benzoate-CoA ligase family protein